MSFCISNGEMRFSCAILSSLQNVEKNLITLSLSLISGIKPFYKYPVVQFPELQKIVSFGRMGGDMFRFDIAGFRNVEIYFLQVNLIVQQ